MSRVMAGPYSKGFHEPFATQRRGCAQYDGCFVHNNILGANMLGLMQSQPLLISSLIEFAERHHGDAEIVSRRVEGDIHRYTYRDLAARARRLANALDAQRLQFSDRVATFTKWWTAATAWCAPRQCVHNAGLTWAMFSKTAPRPLGCAIA